jgi:uncharacterized protein (DUF362 family)
MEVCLNSKQSIVARVQVKPDDDVMDDFLQAMELAGLKSAIQPGRDVLVKINLSWDFFLPGSINTPWSVKATVKALRPLCHRLYLAEGDQVLVSADKASRLVDMDRICRQYDCEWVNISHLPATPRELTPPSPIGKVVLPDILAEVQVVDLAVFKTHFRSTITGALKNLYGFLDKYKHNYHDHLEAVIADLAGYIRPVFSILDGTVGLEGNGPKSGTPRIANLIIASVDPVAVDSEMARLMGFEPHNIGHLVECKKRDLGHIGPEKVQLVGDDVQPVEPPFTPAKKNIVAVIESALRPKWLRGSIFDKTLLFFSRRGAQLWYRIWYHWLSGHKLRDAVLAHPQYGPQWDFHSQRSKFAHRAG